MNLSDATSSLTERSTGTPVSVVIIGAGYAGVLATNRFLASLRDAEREKVRLTVINPRAEFVERIRLHELASGSRRSVTFPLAEILHREARRVVGTAVAIDPEAQTVTTRTAAGVTTQRYDYLIYAPGSAASSPVPGAREHAHLIADLEGAQTAARGRVVVIGGGFTGVETAAEVADHRPDLKVTLLSKGPILAHMRPAARSAILRTNRRLGVAVEDAVVETISHGEVNLAEGRTVPFDVCLLALSFTAPDLARVSGLAVDSSDRLKVDETLRSVTAPNVIGAGDAVVTPPTVGSHLRMGCAVALPLGGHAAETALHLIREQEPKPISIGLILQCLSLGRRRGYIQVVRADDSPRNMALTGRLGATVKEMVSRMVVTSPRKEREKPGAYRAVKGPRADRPHVLVARARAGIMLAIGLLIVSAFDAALTFGAPLGAAAQGGTNPGQLPGALRLGTALFAVLWLFAALLVLARAGLAHFAISEAVSQVGTWVLVGLLGFGTLLNFASSSPWERFGWAPFTLLLLSLSIVLVRSDKPGRLGQPVAETSRGSR